MEKDILNFSTDIPVVSVKWLWYGKGNVAKVRLHIHSCLARLQGDTIKIAKPIL